MSARWVWIGAAIVAIVAITIAIRVHNRRQESLPPPPSVSVVAARVGVFELRVDAQGRIGSPAGSATNLSFGVPGIIKAIDVRVGDRVVAGQPLARLDDTSFLLAVAQTRGDAEAAAANYGGGAVPSAAYRSAEARLRVARDYLDRLERGGPAAQSARTAAVAGTSQADLRVDADRRALTRAEALYAGGIVAQKDVDAARSQLAADLADAQALHAKSGAAGSGPSGVLAQARAEYAQALADLRNAQAQSGSLKGQAARAAAVLGQAESDEAKTVLRSPVDGVVMRLLKHPGEATDMTTPAIVVGPASDRSATLYVPSADSQGIKLGEPVELRLIRSQASSHGHVAAVVPAVDPSTQETTVVVAGLPVGALPGDAVRGIITVSQTRGILVPATAIVQDPQSGKTLVFVRRKGGDGFDARSVTVVGADDRIADVGAGLKAGEEVAARGAYELLAPAGGS
jgi:membrane fusion protein YbhG